MTWVPVKVNWVLAPASDTLWHVAENSVDDTVQNAFHQFRFGLLSCPEW